MKRDLFDSEQVPAPRAAAAGPCGTCGHADAPKLGFIRCDLMPAWRWFPVQSDCQVSPVSWTPRRELTARELAQHGIDRAVEAAEREVPNWSDIGLEYVRRYAGENQGMQFIGHDIVKSSIEAKIVQPPNSKAWGGPIQRAARAGYIRRVSSAPDPNRHANPVPLWESCAV